jgi:hypothetical protein
LGAIDRGAKELVGPREAYRKGGSTRRVARRAEGGAIGLQSGGSPYGSMFSGMPYGGGMSYVPVVQMPHGNGPPNAPNIPNQQQTNPLQNMTQGAELAKLFGNNNSGNAGITTGNLNASGQFTSGPGTNLGFAIYDDGSPVGIMGVAPFASKRGGRVKSNRR